MATNCFISVRDVQYTLLYNGYNIIVVTDIPCHLYMRWSLEPPQKHSQAVERRGLYMHTDVYLCFVAYHDNEQEEAGDTLVHTFVKRPWPICETRYFHFWGSVAGAPCRSTTSVFQLHFATPPLFTGMPLWHNRIVLSTHSIWPTARGGANLSKYGLYQRPQNIQLVRTWLIGTYFIVRAYQNFNTLDVPTGKTITHGRLGIYVTSLTGIVGQLVITKGLWDEPVIEGDFGLQTNETEVLGQINQADLVLNQYNWIDLNSAGIAWVNHKAGDRNQHESYDWQKSAYFDMYLNLWQSQTFTPQNTHTLTSVKLRIKKKGTPGTFYVEIKRADASHNPTGPALATGTKHPDYISTDPWGDWCFIDLWAGFTAEAGIEYCVECHIAGGNASNCVQWIGATATQYPNGYHSISFNGGSSWTAYSQYSTYFIEYETALVGGTNLCLRTSFDNSDVPPTPGQSQEIQFYSAQKGEGYQPLLELVLGPYVPPPPPVWHEPWGTTLTENNPWVIIADPTPPIITFADSIIKLDFTGTPHSGIIWNAPGDTIPLRTPTGQPLYLRTNNTEVKSINPFDNIANMVTFRKDSDFLALYLMIKGAIWGFGSGDYGFEAGPPLDRAWLYIGAGNHQINMLDFFYRAAADLGIDPDPDGWFANLVEIAHADPTPVFTSYLKNDDIALLYI